jgi:AraC-like DNA-binding protein
MKQYETNKALAQALDFAGSIGKLADELGVSERTLYYQVRKGYLSYDFAKAAADRYGLDLAKLQERV